MGEVIFLLSSRNKWSEEQQFNESSNGYLPNGHDTSRIWSHLEMIAQTQKINKEVMTPGCVLSQPSERYLNQFKLFWQQKKIASNHSWYSYYSEYSWVPVLYVSFVRENLFPNLHGEAWAKHSTLWEFTVLMVCEKAAGAPFVTPCSSTMAFSWPCSLTKPGGCGKDAAPFYI